MRLLQSPLVAAIIGLILYTATTALLWPEMKPARRAPEPEAPVMKVRGPSWEFINPEMDELIEELRREKAALAQRRQELEDLAARIQSEKTELGVVTQTVHQIQVDLDKAVTRITDEEAANLKRLSKLYTSMAPDSAITILKELEEPVIVKILALMKDDQIAPLLETLMRRGEAETKLAVTLAERLRLAVFRKPQEKPKS